ncbi:oligogalacturonate-specific porin KdgM family protein [Vibrio sp. PP-XX7]
MSSAAAHAATLNLRQEFTPAMMANLPVTKERVAVSHRFKNGVGFEVEAKWKSKNEDAYGEQVSGGHQANVSYVYKLNERWSLKPQYKWESDSSTVNHQFNLTAGYKINSDWDVSFRHRYNYANVVDGQNKHYNRWTFAAGYAGVEHWKFGATVDYTF